MRVDCSATVRVNKIKPFLLHFVRSLHEDESKSIKGISLLLKLTSIPSVFTFFPPFFFFFSFFAGVSALNREHYRMRMFIFAYCCDAETPESCFRMPRRRGCAGGVSEMLFDHRQDGRSPGLGASGSARVLFFSFFFNSARQSSGTRLSTPATNNLDLFSFRARQ